MAEYNVKPVVFDGFDEYGGRISLNRAIKILIELQREGFTELEIAPAGYDGEIEIDVRKLISE